MIIKTTKTKLFKPNENLIQFIEKYHPLFKEEDVLVITSKIVSLAEGRIVDKDKGINKQDLIRKESEAFVVGKRTTICVKEGMVMTSAGIDESNAFGAYILLPKDSFKTAKEVRAYFIKKHKLKKFAVIISDSRSLPLRRGSMGLAIGYAGIKALKDYRKTKDIFGKKFKCSVVNMVDSLAVSAVACMGEGSEKKPLALIRQAPVEFVDRVNKRDLKVSVEDDIYLPIFNIKR